MSIDQLTNAALALPVTARAVLAQALWRSINEHLPLPSDGDAADATAAKRDVELASGTVSGREHAKVFAAARRALGCG